MVGDTRRGSSPSLAVSAAAKSAKKYEYEHTCIVLLQLVLLSCLVA